MSSLSATVTLPEQSTGNCRGNAPQFHCTTFNGLPTRIRNSLSFRYFKPASHFFFLSTSKREIIRKNRGGNDFPQGPRYIVSRPKLERRKTQNIFPSISQRFRWKKPSTRKRRTFTSTHLSALLINSTSLPLKTISSLKMRCYTVVQRTERNGHFTW